MSSSARPDIADLAAQRQKREHNESIRKVLDAACEVLLENPKSDLTMHAVAARADVPVATVRKLFSSKNEVIAEVCLRAVRAVPSCADVSYAPVVRVTEQLRRMALLLAAGPDVAAACATALMGTEPTLARIRQSIGLEVHRLIAAALGAGAWPEVVATLELTYAGAMAHAGACGLTCGQATDRLETAAALILEGVPRH